MVEGRARGFQLSRPGEVRNTCKISGPQVKSKYPLFDRVNPEALRLGGTTPKKIITCKPTLSSNYCLLDFSPVLKQTTPFRWGGPYGPRVEVSPPKYKLPGKPSPRSIFGLLA